MQTGSVHIYDFGGFQLDTAKRLLRRLDGTPVSLTPRVFEHCSTWSNTTAPSSTKNELWRRSGPIRLLRKTTWRKRFRNFDRSLVKRQAPTTTLSPSRVEAIELLPRLPKTRPRPLPQETRNTQKH